MDLWLSLSSVQLEQAPSLARAAEELGYTGIAVGDHLVTPTRVRSTYPYASPTAAHSAWGSRAAFPDAWQLIASLAAITERLRFTTSVYIVPIRDVFTLAKSVSTAAVLSGERVTLGVGVGWMREEFALTGHSFADRGPRTDEMLAVLERLLTGQAVEHHGRYLDFDSVEMSPTPRRRVPVFVGGLSDAAVRRAARWDGWISPPTDLDGLVPMLDRVERALAAEGTKPAFERMACLAEPPDLAMKTQLADLGVTAVLVPSFRSRGLGEASLADKQRDLERLATRFRADPGPDSS